VIKILLAIAGITGVGKSFFKDKIVEELGFCTIKILTTREPRIGEKTSEDKICVTYDELDKLCNDGKIAYKFELLGNMYAYTKEALFSDKNTVFDLHYNTIFDFKKICPHLVTIYVMPKDINVSKQKLHERNLKPEVEKNRLLEIDEHYKKITTDKKLLNMFDYVVYNNYDKESEENVLNLVKKILEENR
jgi:guanylate kinase